MPKKKKIVSASEKTKKGKGEQKIIVAADVILEAMIDGVCVVDISGCLVQCNAAYAKIHGINDPAEIVGKNITELIAEREIPRVMDEFKKHLETGARTNLEFFIKDRNNKEIPIQINSKVLKDEKGKIVGAIAIMRDITEPKQAQEKLIESEKKYKDLFNFSNDTILIVDLSERIIDVNNTACERYNYKRDEFQKMTLQEIDSPEFAKRVPEKIKMLKERGYAVFESGHMTKDGRFIPVEVSARIIDYNGQPAILSVIRDITELKQAQEALQKSGEWLLTTLKSIGDAVIATDSKGNVSLMNPVSENLTGWKQEEAAGKPLNEIFNIINEKTGKPAENPAERVMKEGAVVGLANHTVLIAKDGTKYPIDDSGAPIKDDKGNIIGVILVFRDISERKVVQNQLEERLRDLERFQKFAVDRENRIIELKEKVKKLEARLGGG